MDKYVIANSIRFIILLIIQVAVLKYIDLGMHISILLYPLFIVLLPFHTPNWMLIISSFLLGLSVDVFYDSLGVHAFVGTLVGYLRPMIANLVAPRGGYDVQQTPTKHSLGIEWFIRYSGIIFFLHLLVFFILEFFSINHFGVLLLNTLISFVIVMIINVIVQYIFNPKV